MPIETKPCAFLYYSRKDEGVVRQFAAYLAQEEIPPWVDNQLEFGERWEDVIMERLQGCTVFLIAMGPDAKASAFVNREISVALAQRKLIIPILLRGDPFPELQEYQYVSLTDTDKSAVRFIERLRNLLTPIRCLAETSSAAEWNTFFSAYSKQFAGIPTEWKLQ